MPKKEIGELILFYQSIIDDAKYDNSDQALAFLDFEKAGLSSLLEPHITY